MAKFLAFGEIMLRLSPPGRELLMQTPRFDVWVAGAEAKVLTTEARRHRGEKGRPHAKGAKDSKEGRKIGKFRTLHVQPSGAKVG